MRVLYVKLDVEMQVYVVYVYIWFSFFAYHSTIGMDWLLFEFFFFRYLVRYTLSALFQDRKYCKLCMYVSVCNVYARTVYDSLTQVLRKCYSMQQTWKQQHTISTHHFVNEWMNEWTKKSIRKPTPIRKQS